jgi:hypothetical protein
MTRGRRGFGGFGSDFGAGASRRSIGADVGSAAGQRSPPQRNPMTTIAMYPNNDTLGERLRLYVEENLHDA